MGRGDLERLSKEELIELVLRLQRPEKTSRTSSKPPSTDRKEQREKSKPGGAKIADHLVKLLVLIVVAARMQSPEAGHQRLIAFARFVGLGLSRRWSGSSRPDRAQEARTLLCTRLAPCLVQRLQRVGWRLADARLDQRRRKPQGPRPHPVGQVGAASGQLSRLT